MFIGKKKLMMKRRYRCYISKEWYSMCNNSDHTIHGILCEAIISRRINIKTNNIINNFVRIDSTNLIWFNHYHLEESFEKDLGEDVGEKERAFHLPTFRCLNFRQHGKRNEIQSRENTVCSIVALRGSLSFPPDSHFVVQTRIQGIPTLLSI